MTRPVLGSVGGKPLAIDLTRLLETRLLMTASSGWGKSWALRRLLEQTHGQVQQLVIDPEGEFATLRERCDFVIAGKGGDCPAEPRSADLLARRLLELGASAVLDLYELPPHDRVRFVRRFLEALVDAPKALWRPALVVIDEAHAFCPEKDEAESGRAVRDLMSRGRKRGFAACLATQRLAKLAKDAAAEAGNVLVGRFTLDLDVRRAADTLGFGKDRWPELRRLAAGEFFAFGPALSEDVVRVKVGTVETTHPKAGARQAATAPAPRERVRKVLEQLRDLPAEAEAEARSAEELRAKLRERERELAAARRGSASPADLATAEAKGAQRATEHVQRDHQKQLARVVASAEAGRRRAAAALDQALDQIKRASDALREPIDVPEVVGGPRESSGSGSVALRRAPSREVAQRSAPAEGLTAREQRVLDALAWWAAIGVEEPDKGQVGFIAGYRVSRAVGGTFGNILGRLRSLGLIDYPDGAAALTDEGRAIARAPREHPTTEALHGAIEARLDAREWRVLSVLIDAYPDPVTKQDCGERAGYTVGPAVGGTFGNILGRLRSLGLIDYQEGQVVALPVLFLEAPSG